MMMKKKTVKMDMMKKQSMWSEVFIVVLFGRLLVSTSLKGSKHELNQVPGLRRTFPMVGKRNVTSTLPGRN